MSILDLPAALRAAGLTVWVAPDWRTNGHTYELIDPFGGVLHHTAGHGLRAVYGLPDARPDVPQPRCNVWTPRPGTQPYDVAVISAGRAWQAGTGRMHAYDRMRAGGFSVRTPDAAVLYGPNSDDVDAGWTSQHTLGNEVEWNTGDPWTTDHLDVVATTMGVCVDVLGWAGLGSWAHHRQLTYRKPDMDYRGDLWGRAAAITRGDDMSAEDVKAINDHTDAGFAELQRQLAGNLGAAAVNNPLSWLNAGIAARVDRNTAARLAPLLDDEPKLLAALADHGIPTGPGGVSLDDIRAALRLALADVRLTTEGT